MHLSLTINRLEPVTAVIDILEVGSATFDFPANLTANQGRPSAGIGDPIQNRALFFVDSPALASYDLTTRLDTVNGEPIFIPGLPFPTTSGPFVLVSATCASFQAIPEPSSLFLMSAAILASLSTRLTQRSG